MLTRCVAVALKLRHVSSHGRKRLCACAYRVLHHVYYRHLFGLRMPGAAYLARTLIAWEVRQGRGDVPAPEEAWEAQYRAGRWAYLSGIQQLARYEAIAAYIQAFKRNGCVLDVGCGEGILLERLNPGDYAKLVGIDLSHTAIARAQDKQYARSVFMQADARHFVPEERFDVILFNEVLYYFDDPLAVTQRYRAWLKRDGLLITSLFARSERARAIGRQLKKTYPSIAEVEIIGEARSWLINVMAPSGGADERRRA